jgi:hypothetical protein
MTTEETPHELAHDHGAAADHDDFGGLDRDRRLFGRRAMLGLIAEDVNYLRGVQAAADDGTLSFTSIYPACYSGR